MEARLSLARSAKLLVDQGIDERSLPLATESEADLSSSIEKTDWGNARQLIPAHLVDGTPMQWSYPATNLGSALPQWDDRPRSV